MIVKRAHRASEGAVVRPAVVRTLPVLVMTSLLWICTLVLPLTAAWGWSMVSGLAATVLSLAMAGSALVRDRFMAVTVLGSSMAPAYRHGDRVLIRRGSAARSGQVVVVKPEGPGQAGSHESWIIKRVVAAPGDPVPHHGVPALADVTEDQVPPGQLVLFGDNLDVSVDSRQLGYFSSENVAGTVLRRLHGKPRPQRDP